MDTKNRFIFTCNLKYEQLAIYELGKNDDSFSFIVWLREGVGLFETKISNEQLCIRIKETPIIFVRHIFRVDGVNSILNVDDMISEILSQLKRCFLSKKTFSIQYRGNIDSQDSNLTVKIAEEIKKNGYIIDVTNSEIIISLFLKDEKIYWGIGDENSNLSHWKGGMPHYSSAQKYQFVSRAEFKLLEAIECFNIDVSGMKMGADLGAAPGGWTKVLINNGIECTSIDPSYLKPEIANNSRVKYYHMTVEDYIKLDLHNTFDIVVNDMKMDVKKSINIINQFYYKINDGGIVIITFKLPHEFSYKDIVNNIGMFDGFLLIGARQLFHNRSEITVVLKKDKIRRKKLVLSEKIVEKESKINDHSKKIQRRINKRKRKKV